MTTADWLFQNNRVDWWCYDNVEMANVWGERYDNHSHLITHAGHMHAILDHVINTTMYYLTIKMYKQNLKPYFIINRDKCAEQIKIHMLKLQILLRNRNAPYVSSHMFCSKVKRLFKYYSQHSNALRSFKTIFKVCLV